MDVGGDEIIDDGVTGGGDKYGEKKSANEVADGGGESIYDGVSGGVSRVW